jgi:hypothetical protein
LQEISPGTQQMPEVFPVVTHTFLAPPFQKRSKLETLNPGLLCKVSKGISRGMYKSRTDFIQFLFNQF